MAKSGAMVFDGELDVSDLDMLQGGEEFARMWSLSNGGMACLVDPAALNPDPFVFGLAMVDAIKHGAKAYAQAVNITEEHAFERIMEGFNAELQNPTDDPKQVAPKIVN